MIDKCPKCGGELEATVPLYLDEVVVEDGVIVGYRVAFGDGALASIEDAVGEADPIEVRIYCENDHQLDLSLI